MQPSKINIEISGGTIVTGEGEFSLDDLKIRMLNGFPDSDFLEFFRIGYTQAYYQNDLILTADEQDSSVYILIDGSVSVWKHDAPVMHLRRGEVFNESVVFFPRTDASVVRSEGITVVYKVSREALMEYFVSRPERLFKIFTLNVMAIMQHKIVFYESQIAKKHHQFK